MLYLLCPLFSLISSHPAIACSRPSSRSAFGCRNGLSRFAKAASTSPKYAARGGDRCSPVTSRSGQVGQVQRNCIRRNLAFASGSFCYLSWILMVSLALNAIATFAIVPSLLDQFQYHRASQSYGSLALSSWQRKASCDFASAMAAFEAIDAYNAKFTGT
eukprot:6195267-Pleurochrysis_carterae.AAC.1